jgi:asparagine synthase (glutamine-hydrolysing)
VGVPFEPSPAKLKLLRRINPALANITYERTKVKPSRPHPVHVAGFVGNVVANRLLSNPTYGNGSLADIWIRDTDSPVHDHVSALVDDACSRELFNADAVRELYDAHMAGENNAALLAQITTLEHWIGTYLD